MSTETTLAALSQAIDALEAQRANESAPAGAAALTRQIETLLAQKINLRTARFIDRSQAIVSAAESLRQIIESTGLMLTHETRRALREAAAQVAAHIAAPPMGEMEAASACEPDTSASCGTGRSPLGATCPCEPASAPDRGQTAQSSGLPVPHQSSPETLSNPLQPIRLLFVHGVGDHHSDTRWQEQWYDAAQRAIRRWRPDAIVEPAFCMYDDLAQHHGVEAEELTDALMKFALSGLWHSIGDAIAGESKSAATSLSADEPGSSSGWPGLESAEAPERAAMDVHSGACAEPSAPATRKVRKPDERGNRGRAGTLADLPRALRWTAGMVAQWRADETFRRDTRQRLTQCITNAPTGGFDAVIGHSLGSLVCYDTLSRDPQLLAGRTLVTLGSQIGSPFVRSAFDSRIAPLPGVKQWFHLFNPNDRAFTAPLKLSAANFTQIDATFDTPGDVINHDALGYFEHPNVSGTMWRELSDAKARVHTASETK